MVGRHGGTAGSAVGMGWGVSCVRVEAVVAASEDRDEV
jgi:hypothetical protein